jgi:hypothetical protein
MSRSGYTDDAENVELWRAAVDSALSGQRGQAFLREMLAAFDALPKKCLIADELVTAEGECCAIGSVALRRGLDVSKVDMDDRDEVAEVFGIAPAMAAEIMWLNDEYLAWRHGGCEPEEPALRFERMRSWIVSQIQVRPEELVTP